MSRVDPLVTPSLGISLLSLTVDSSGESWLSAALTFGTKVSNLPKTRDVFNCVDDD